MVPLIGQLLISRQSFLNILSGDEDNSHAAEIDPVELFETLPDEMIGEMAVAAKVRNLTKLTEIAKKLLKNDQTSVAGHHLEGLIMTFDFAGLQAILDALTPAGQEN